MSVEDCGVHATVVDDVLQRNLDEMRVAVDVLRFPAAIWVGSCTNALYGANSALIELSCFTRHELEQPAFNPAMLLEPESLVAIRDATCEAHANSKITTTTRSVYLKRKDGRKMVYTCGITFLRGSTGTLHGALLVFLPVPDQ
jgi:hypothetical protein